MIVKEIRKDRTFCDDITKIENYDIAANDTENKWVMHHRLETHDENGNLREKSVSRQELQDAGMYWHRPPEELIFLTASEHTKLHNQFVEFTEERRQRMSEAAKKLKGKKDYMKTESYRKAVSEAKKRQHIVTRGSTGMHWFTNGIDNVMSFDCPDGYWKGRTACQLIKSTKQMAHS